MASVCDLLGPKCPLRVTGVWQEHRGGEFRPAQGMAVQVLGLGFELGLWHTERNFTSRWACVFLCLSVCLSHGGAFPRKLLPETLGRWSVSASSLWSGVSEGLRAGGGGPESRAILSLRDVFG